MPILRTAMAGAVLGAIVAAAVRRNGKRPAADRGASAQAGDKDVDVAKASRNFLNFVLLPVWMIPGFGDYLCHRASKIERTSGSHESMTHMLMISTTAVGIVAGLAFEVNELVLLIMTAAAIAHEAIVIWDVGYAAKLRRQSPAEQHMHSFLEVLPLTGLAFTMCLNPDDVAVLIGRGRRPSRFRLVPNPHPAAPRYLAAVVGLATVILFLPYAEELLRCYRVDRTFRPHHEPIDPAAI